MEASEDPLKTIYQRDIDYKKSSECSKTCVNQTEKPHQIK